METQALDELAGEGVKGKDRDIQRYADMRYSGQEHTVKVPLPASEITDKVIPKINKRFHTLHEQTYTFRLETPVELVNYHITALGRVAKPEFKKLSDRSPLGNGREDSLHGDRADRSAAAKGMRRVNFDELGFHEAAIYERDRLPVGAAVEGPAVIEEPASTTVVFPDQKLTRDEYGFLHIEMVA